MKKRTKLAVASTLVLGLAFVGAGAADAAQTEGGATPKNNLVNIISQKFKLNSADVQKVFDEEHIKMRTDMETKRSIMEKESLAKAVSSGKLTQAQSDAITAKRAELAMSNTTLRASLEGKSKEETQAAMKTRAENLKKWVTDNGIPGEYISLVGGHSGKVHDGRGFGPQAMKGQ